MPAHPWKKSALSRRQQWITSSANWRWHLSKKICFFENRVIIIIDRATLVPSRMSHHTPIILTPKAITATNNITQNTQVHLRTYTIQNLEDTKTEQRLIFILFWSFLYVIINEVFLFSILFSLYLFGLMRVNYVFARCRLLVYRPWLVQLLAARLYILTFDLYSIFVSTRAGTAVLQYLSVTPRQTQWTSEG